VVATDDSTPKWSTKDRALLRTVTELLEAGEYERLGELLDRVRSASDRERDPIAAHTLDLARRICLACGQSQAEAEWHQQAREEAAQREDQLRVQLDALLKLDGVRDKSSIAPDLSASLEPPSLWRRLKGLLRVRPGTGMHEGVAIRAAAPPVLGSEKPPAPIPRVDPKEGENLASPSLVVYCLGQFRVYQDEQSVEDWPSSKG